MVGLDSSAARQGLAAAGHGREKGATAWDGVGSKLEGAWASMGYLEHVGVVGGAGEAPGCPGDGDRQRRGRFTGAGDLERRRAQVSDQGCLRKV